MTQIIGPVEPEKKAQLDNAAKWIEYFIYGTDFPGRLLWAESWILKYQAVLDETS